MAHSLAIGKEITSFGACLLVFVKLLKKYRTLKKKNQIPDYVEKLLFNIF